LDDVLKRTADSSVGRGNIIRCAWQRAQHPVRRKRRAELWWICGGTFHSWVFRNADWCGI